MLNPVAAGVTTVRVERRVEPEARKRRASTSLDLDMKDEANSSLEISTGIETLDALFDALAETAEFGTLKCVASGDTWIDDHHTTEDVAITIGQCLKRSVGEQSRL